jgi:hypothetical protein
MKKLLFGALTITSAAWFAGDAAAHGGTYRGPGDTVPPGAGGGGGGAPPTTGGPQGPAPEGPKGPNTPPGGGAPPLPGVPPTGGGPTTGAPADISTDLEAWSFWWEFNKDPFLNLKAKIHSTSTTTGSSDFFLGDGSQAESKDTYKPSEDDIRTKIVPALIRALEKETNNDIVTGCLIALAKIGDKPTEGGEADSEFSEIIARFLKDSNQEISETAALALGILGNSSKNNVDRLVDLMTDTPKGREDRGSAGDGVPTRTRTFAAYGLGLVGYRTTAVDVRTRIVQTFADSLAAAERAGVQDLAAGIVISMGLVPLDPSGEIFKGEIDLAAPGAVDTLEKQIALLLAVYGTDRLDRYMRAHVPTALVRLVATLDGRGMDEHRRELKKLVAETLLVALDPRKGRGYEEEIQQSVCLALGLLGDCDDDEIDQEIRKVLLEAHKDQQRQAKNFSLIALGKIGARDGEEFQPAGDDPAAAPVPSENPGAARDEIAKHLLSRLSSGKSGEEHWAGLGIGVLAWNLREQKLSVDKGTLLPLLAALDKSKAVEDIGAFSISNGIAGNPESRPRLRELLAKTSDPIGRGYVALALGLLDAQDALEEIKAIVEQSEYKPDLLKQAAIALGLLGDKNTVMQLVGMLGEAKSLATQASLASALGFIGDKRSVVPLVEMLEDSTMTPTARGFAAVALGIVADKEPLPWNSKIAVDLNYRASLPTLNTQDGKGVLNIL